MMLHKLHKIRILMEKNKYLKNLVPIIQETKLMQYKHQFIHSKARNQLDFRLANERKEAFRKCYEEHKPEFARTSELLEDDFSRKTLRAVISYRLSPCTRTLLPIIASPQYFPKDIIKKRENLVFIDGGGFVGDTIISLAAFWGKNTWKKIYSWEPDNINRKQLVETCRIHNFQNIEILPFGLWSDRSEMHFTMNGKDWSRVSKDGPATIAVDSIDHLCSTEKIDFIKMDIEGSELEALRGAEQVIRRDKPMLAISIYHKPEDYFQIPLFIKQLVPDYKLYIRHHKLSKNDTVLYAVI